MTKADNTNRINLYFGDYVVIGVVMLTVIVSNKILQILEIIPSVREVIDSNITQGIILSFIYIAILTAVGSILGELLSIKNNIVEKLILDSKKPNVILEIMSDQQGRTFEEIDSILQSCSKESSLVQKIKLGRYLRTLEALGLLRAQTIAFNSKKERVTKHCFFITDKGQALLEKQQLEKQEMVNEQSENMLDGENNV
jgi:hypothetical protein